MSEGQTRGLSHMTKFCVALTFDDVSTIWLYKASITRMVGRLFVSLNEVLNVAALGTANRTMCSASAQYQLRAACALENGQLGHVM
jgi:hypothetical protein